MNKGEVNKWAGVRKKIQTVFKAEAKGIRYFANDLTMDFTEFKEVYIFYAENFGFANQTEVQTFFFKLHKTHEGNHDIIFCIFDLSIKVLPDVKPNTIAHYKEGKKVSDDVVGKSNF